MISSFPFFNGEKSELQTKNSLRVFTALLPRIDFTRSLFQLIAFRCRKKECLSKFQRMTAINVIRHSDGRTFFRCGASPIPPTNPRKGPPTSLNTVVWSERTRVTTLIIPRQNGVNLDTWSPQSNLRTYSGPVTYAKPPFRQGIIDPTAIRKSSINDPCPPRLPNQMQCIGGRLVRR